MAPRPAAGWDRALPWLIALGLVGFLLRSLSFDVVLDGDTFHEMALVREALATGVFPRHDPFAFTPTLPFFIHHEWGTGAVMLAAWNAFGPVGLSVIRYALAAGILAAAFATARLRGASPGAVAVTGPLALALLAIGLAPVRAQIFTYLLFAILLLLLERDRRGARGWMAPWLVLYVLWVNLHGGFVVGLGAVGVSLVERWARAGWRAGMADARRLGALLAAMAALVLVNPYGTAYVPFLWRAIRMSRPLVAEWAPIWDPRVDRRVAVLFALSLVVLGYALWRAGVRRAVGLGLLAVTAVASARSHRHLPLYAIAWFTSVAPLLRETALGRIVDGWTVRRRAAVAAVALFSGALGAWRTVESRAWRLTTPSDPGSGWRAYPVGAVDRLAAAGFSGNVLTEFETGAYVTWRLYPAVKVSLDGRYEVAYDQSVVDDHVRLLCGGPGWKAVLDRYSPDAIVLHRAVPVVALLEREPAWELAFQDRTWALFLRRASGRPAP